jgi:hypothetical protein
VLPGYLPFNLPPLQVIAYCRICKATHHNQNLCSNQVPVTARRIDYGSA